MGRKLEPKGIDHLQTKNINILQRIRTKSLCNRAFKMSRMQSKITQKIKNHENVKKQPTNTPRLTRYWILEIIRRNLKQLSPPFPPGDKGNSYKISRKIEAPRREMNVT